MVVRARVETRGCVRPHEPTVFLAQNRNQHDNTRIFYTHGVCVCARFLSMR